MNDTNLKDRYERFETSSGEAAFLVEDLWERIEELERAEAEYQQRLRICMDMLAEKGVSAGEVWDRREASLGEKT